MQPFRRRRWKYSRPSMLSFIKYTIMFIWGFLSCLVFQNVRQRSVYEIISNEDTTASSSYKNLRYLTNMSTTWTAKEITFIGKSSVVLDNRANTHGKHQLPIRHVEQLGSTVYRTTHNQKSVSNTVTQASLTPKPSLIEGCDNFFKAWLKTYTSALPKEIEWYQQTQCKIVALPKCHSKNLIGPLSVDFSPISIQNLSTNHLSYMKRGGWLGPIDCKVSQHVDLIISVHDREHHVPIVLRN